VHNHLEKLLEGIFPSKSLFLANNNNKERYRISWSLSCSSEVLILKLCTHGHEPMN
jgi:hypothetical protein